MIAAVVLAGCSGGGPSGPTGHAGPAGAPARSAEFRVDPVSSVAMQVATWPAQGRGDDARQLEKIARQPIATWVSGDLNKVEGQTRQVTEQAAAARTTSVITTYNVPDRDCGQYSSGGPGNDDQYRPWVTRGPRGHPAVMVLEPDAIAQGLTSCEGRGKTARREALLKGAVRMLAGAGAKVYIDAGNPGLVTDVAELAEGLGKSGVERAAGFALNVANFRPTTDLASFGEKVSDQLGGPKFVIDISRNGNGSYSGSEQPTRCYPSGRALGTPPTRQTGIANVDDVPWVERPGESDSNSRGTAPDVGKFWPDYAAKATP